MHDLIALDDSSRVWIYQADRELTYDELDIARPRIYKFIDSWISHNRQLIGYGNIFHRRFIALFVDESIAGASGCSIDSSVRFLKDLGAELNVDLFGRNEFAYFKEDEIYTTTKSELKSLKESGNIDNETMFFNNLVSTKGDFLKGWVAPLETTWLNKFA